MFFNTGSHDKEIRRNQAAILRKEKLNKLANSIFHFLTLGMFPLTLVKPFDTTKNLEAINSRQNQL